MTAPLLERVRVIAADVLETSPGSLNAQSSSENMETWDSVRHLNLVLAIEQEFDVQLEPEEMDQMNSIARIVAVLESKGKS